METKAACLCFVLTLLVCCRQNASVFRSLSIFTILLDMRVFSFNIACDLYTLLFCLLCLSVSLSDFTYIGFSFGFMSCFHHSLCSASLVPIMLRPFSASFSSTHALHRPGLPRRSHLSLQVQTVSVVHVRVIPLYLSNTFLCFTYKRSSVHFLFRLFILLELGALLLPVYMLIVPILRLYSASLCLLFLFTLLFSFSHLVYCSSLPFHSASLTFFIVLLYHFHLLLSFCLLSFFTLLFSFLHFVYCPSLPLSSAFLILFSLFLPFSSASLTLFIVLLYPFIQLPSLCFSQTHNLVSLTPSLYSFAHRSDCYTYSALLLLTRINASYIALLYHVSLILL